MNKNLKLANDPAGLNASEVQLPENAAAALANMLQALSKLPAVVLELAELFTAKGQELSLVGGPVRGANLTIGTWQLQRVQIRPNRF